VADFTGRRAELDAIGAAGRPVTIITGPPGIGKTVFAVHVGHLRRDHYPDGQLFANLHGYEQSPTRPADVLGRFLRALGVPVDHVPADPEEREALFRSVTATSRLLVVLDNARDEAQVRRLIPAGPACDVLVTSRSFLPGVEGAARLRLALPPVGDALELLASIAGAEQVGAKERTARQVANLCGLLPLAVRIAGARLASQPDWPLEELARTLDNERTRLRELAVGDLDVRAAFDLSYQMLDRAHRQIYGLLGITPVHAFTAGAVAALTELPLGRCAPLLESFADLSLIQIVAPGRYQLHDLLRLYAAEHATADAEEDERTAAIERLLSWYVSMANSADQLIVPQRRRHAAIEPPNPPPSFQSRAEALTWCDTERAELAEITRAADRIGRHELVWLLPTSLWGYITLRRNWAEWLPVLRAGLRSAQSTGDWLGQGSMLGSLGLGYLDLRIQDEAIACLKPFLAIATAAGDRLSQVAALTGLGIAQRDLAKVDQAVAHLDEAALETGADDRWSVAFARLGLGLAYRELQRPTESIVHLEQALAAFRQAEDQAGVVWTLQNLSAACRDLNRLDESLAYLRQALPIRRELGDKRAEMAIWMTLSEINQQLGRKTEQNRTRAQAEAIMAEIGKLEMSDKVR
jgi:tetratricopeptide (TPR) repeat protein